MIHILLSLALSPNSHAAPPKPAFTKAPLSCEMSWASGTAYVPMIAEGKAKWNLQLRHSGAPHYWQEIVRNTDAEEGPLWSGGVLVSEAGEGRVSVGLYLKGQEEIARADVLVPSSTKKFPALQLSVRVPESEEKKSEERHYTAVELRCFSK